MTKTLDELMALSKAAHDGGTPQRAALESALRELIAERDTLNEALWKACGDDGDMVFAYIESQRTKASE